MCWKTIKNELSKERVILGTTYTYSKIVFWVLGVIIAAGILYALSKIHFVVKYAKIIFPYLWNLKIRVIEVLLIGLLFLLFRKMIHLRKNRFDFLDKQSRLILGVLIVVEDKVLNRRALKNYFNKELGYGTAAEYNLKEMELIQKGLIEVGLPIMGIEKVGITPKGCEFMKKLNDRIKLSQSIKTDPQEPKSDPDLPPPSTPTKQS